MSTRQPPDALDPHLATGWRNGLWLRAFHDLPPILPHELEWRKANVPPDYPAKRRQEVVQP